MLDDAASTLLDAEQSAHAARVPGSTFRRWAAAGRITPCGTAGDGRALYREADVLRAEMATRRAPRAARLLTAAAHDMDRLGRPCA
jgi:hypothetical protein